MAFATISGVTSNGMLHMVSSGAHAASATIMAFSRVTSATPSSFIVTGRPSSMQKPKTSSSFSVGASSSTSWTMVPKATFSP